MQVYITTVKIHAKIHTIKFFLQSKSTVQTAQGEVSLNYLNKSELMRCERRKKAGL